MSVPDIERWRGGVDEKLRGHADDIRDLRKRGDDHGVRLGVLEVTVGKMAVKIGVAATVGSLLGGGLVSLVIFYATGGH